MPLERTLALRHRVLRPHRRFEEVAMEGDDDPGTVSLAAVAAGDGSLLSVCRVGPEAPSFPTAGLVPAGTACWRLRGMATREDARNRGVGSAVVQAAVDLVAAEGGGLLWCHARLAARNLYRRAGFVEIGEVWEEPVIGPHVAMWRTVAAAAAPPGAAR